jgi:lipoyl(octanoyl) transferase
LNVLKFPLQIHSEFIGSTAYAEAVALMEKTIASSAEDTAHIWGLEHPLVYTTGLKTEAGHILDPSVKLQPARRGGSVTLHNAGQLVVYFVFPLIAVEGGLERFVRVLEAALAETLLDLKVPVNFSPGASGVFSEKGKIAFIGLGLKKNFIYHGVSLNIANDLNDFRAIQSCGLTLPMTRMADFNAPAELPQLFEKFSAVLGERFEDITPDEFRKRVEQKYNLADWPLGFKLGWLAFHERRYWEAHELWEMFWHEMPPGSLRIFFHAMIQVAMAFYKIFTVPNAIGAHSLLAKGLDKLHTVAEIQLLIDQPDFVLFLEHCHIRLSRALEAGGEIIPPPLEEFVPPVMAWV